MIGEASHMVIEGNLFRNIYGTRVPIMYLLQNNVREVRLIMKDNIYYQVVGFTATILQYRQFDQSFADLDDNEIRDALIKFDAEGSDVKIDLSLIYMENELLANTYSENDL